MYKPDLALNNLQWLICHKIKPNQNLPISLLQVGCDSSFLSEVKMV